MDDRKGYLTHATICFEALCFSGAGYMVYSEVCHFLNNDDSSSIGYKTFNKNADDRYPTFSLCLYSPPDVSMQRNFKENIEKYLNIEPTELNRLLKGFDDGGNSSLAESIFNKISRLGYDTFTLQLRNFLYAHDLEKQLIDTKKKYV